MAAGQPRQLIVEGVVIVVSILLAFAIDAAWEDRLERIRLEKLLLSMQADVLVTQDAIQVRHDWAVDVVARARRILQGIAGGAEGEQLEALVFDVGNVFVKGRWVAVNNTYEQALGAGDLALIDDVGLRLLLGRYAESLDRFTAFQDDVITQYYGQLEPFMVAHTDYAQVAWAEESESLVQTPFATDAQALARSREFANLLNFKLELELEAINALANLSDLSDQVLSALENH